MAARKPKIRVIIADDHAILRSGLKLLINTQADMEAVAEAADGDLTVEALHETRADVVLLDLAMPKTGGMAVLQKIVRDFPRTRVLVLTMHDDAAYLRSALAGGASGYIVKRSVDAELLAAIRAVHRGGIFVDPSLADLLIQDLLPKRDTTRGSANLLSPREMQVLGLVARGYTSQEIAEQILVSVKTIETYRSRLAVKLGLRTRSDLVRFAIRMGLLSPDAAVAEDGK